MTLMHNGVKSKVIPSVLLNVHDNWSPEFWCNHDIENCKDCQEKLKK